MLKIVKEARDLNRLREILIVLFEEGFEFLIEKVRLKHSIPVAKIAKAKMKKKNCMKDILKENQKTFTQN